MEFFYEHPLINGFLLTRSIMTLMDITLREIVDLGLILQDAIIAIMPTIITCQKNVQIVVSPKDTT